MLLHKYLKPFFSFGLLAIAVIFTSCGSSPKKSTSQKNSYWQINLVSNRTDLKPQILEPQLKNAWGLANRPAGFGGHFWITAQKTGSSLEYVGDVNGKKLFQDELKTVRLFDQKKPATPTGVVFNPTLKFVIRQPSVQGVFTAESKFIFATDAGQIYAWSEQKKENGSMLRPDSAVKIVDRQKRGDQYFGLALSEKNEKLYVADFGTHPKIRVFNSSFKEEKLAPTQFQNPFIHGLATQANQYGPYNVQILNDHAFVTYSIIAAKKESEEIDPGEEQKGKGLGRVAEFDLNGQLIRTWTDKGMLNAPWGLAIAPSEGFGKFSGALLVGNFGDGTIVAFDPKTQEAIDYLRTENGTPIEIDGLWGLLFGNGASLGEKNHLYFAAGPNDEADGLFGKIQSH